MRMAQEEEQSQIKLLLLGSENSGKSTVMKQFQIIHKMGFSAEERKVFRDQLWKSAIESMRALVNMREDYLAAHNPTAAGGALGYDAAALDPYVQFLQARVLPDQALHEEVNIPVAARTMPSPRASLEFSSPSYDSVKCFAAAAAATTSSSVSARPRLQQPHHRNLRARREFASLEEEVVYRRTKFQAREHAKPAPAEFASLEEEARFYRRRIARKRALLEEKDQAAAITASASTAAAAYTPPLSFSAPTSQSSSQCTSPTNASAAAAAAAAAAASSSGNIHQVHWDKLSIGRLLQRVWADPIIQLCFAQEEQNPILDAPLSYIMKEMDRIGQPGFQPTNEDVLNCRKRTTGATFLKFEAYDTRFLLIDVGGQKSERKRWILHFDNADVVIFVVGMDQYDQVDAHDGENKLKDAMDLFRDMCKSPWLCTSSFLLFINKTDIFKTKIKQVPFTASSPYLKKEYKGDPHDYEQCTKFIIRKFQQIHAEWYQVEKERRRSSANHLGNGGSFSTRAGGGAAAAASSTPASSFTAGAARRATSPSFGLRRRLIGSGHRSTLSQQQQHELSQAYLEDQIPQMYWYVTCATDTESMKFIIHMCRDIFLKKEMAKFGFTDV